MYVAAEWKLLVLILTIASCRLVSGYNCWTNDAECVVQATLHKNGSAEQAKTMRESLPLEIDCMTTNSKDEQTQASIAPVVSRPPDYLLKRFERAFRVTLNGCRKAFKWPTFGFEYLPNCDKITEMKVTRFHADASYELHCPRATFIQLEVLRFEHNEIATITTEALSNLALLKELHFNSNALRHVERGAFDNLHFIERLDMEAEGLLVIKDATLFARTNVASLRLFQLKLVTSALFEKLPQTLRELHVEKTTIGVGAASNEVAANANIANVNNSGILSSVSLVECALRGLRLNDDHGSVQYLNLSGNLLEELILTNNNATDEAVQLRVLDLSHNHLKYFPLHWLSKLSHLEKLFLNGNSLRTMPLMPLLLGLPAIQNMDWRNNQLEALTNTTLHSLDGEALYRVVIYIDNNPWNCKWLLAFAHTHPELFRIFHYEKFLSQINVNGLECVPEEPQAASPPPFNISELRALENDSGLTRINGKDAIQDHMNVSTFTLIYGSPYDLKRNQRAEALIIVFMLPVGIAVLFLLLYLWIYCQKVFHLSFYRSCYPCKRRQRLRQVNHFDVVRQLPPTTTNTNTTTTTTTTVNNNEDYELPLNGTAPVCNCAHSNSNFTCNTSNLPLHEKCHGTHHITYVPWPDEQAQTIYEEIIGGDEVDIDDAVVVESKSNESHVQAIYDHLAATES